jgi:arsenate reductase-like glutaredoxin family protein
MLTIFTGPNCPKCRLLKTKFEKKGGIRWVDTSTTDGQAEALVEEIYTLPTLVVEDGKKINTLTEIMSVVERL